MRDSGEMLGSGEGEVGAREVRRFFFLLVEGVTGVAGGGEEEGTGIGGEGRGSAGKSIKES